MQKIYTIIGGVNGVGKSSLSKAFRNVIDLGTIIDPDKMEIDLKISNYKASRIAIMEINRCINEGISFTQETTISNNVLNNIAKAKAKGYTIKLFYIGLICEKECISRVLKRYSRGGHDIDTRLIIDRFDKRFESLLKILDHCDEVEFYSNEYNFEKVAEYDCKTKKLVITEVNDVSEQKWVEELKLIINKVHIFQNHRVVK